MKQDSVTCRYDSFLEKLLFQNRYTGSDGAIAYFENVYLSKASEDLLNGDFYLARRYISILIDAVTYLSYSDSGWFIKGFYQPRTVRKALYWVKVMRVHLPQDCVTTEDYYLWITVLSQNLKVSKRLRGKKHVARKIAQSKSDLRDMSFFISLACKKEDTEIAFYEVSVTRAKNFLSLQEQMPICQKYRDLLRETKNYQRKLLSEARLYDLHSEGMYELHDPCLARERLWAYAVLHENSTDVEMLRTVHTLFHTISYYEDASNVKEKISLVLGKDDVSLCEA
jgi:hypothetical protein